MADEIRILLVDDQPHFAELAKTFLEREDDRFIIDTANSAADGLQRLEDGEYDCIVSDYDMPGANGLEFFETVDDEGLDLPFILFTGVDSESLQEKDRFEGVTAYLQKGGKSALEALASRIRVTVNEHRADRLPLEVEERYDALFEQSTFAMAWVHSNGGGPVVVDCNNRFRDEFLGAGSNGGHHPLGEVLNSVSIDPETVNKSLSRGEPATLEGEMIDHDEVKHFQWRIIPINGNAHPADGQALIAAHDISDQAFSEHALEIYRTIVEASGDPMYVLDISGEFAYVNDALLDLSGYPREKLIGKNGSVVMAEEDYEEGTQLIKELLRSDVDSATFEMDLHTADGSVIPCENHIALIYNIETGNGDEVKGTAGVLRDISARKERLAELRRYNERLEELAAFISHDLRNPISIASGHLQLIDPAGHEEHYQAIQQSIKRMEELIDDLLLMARSGQTVIEEERVDLRDAAQLSWSQISTNRATIDIRDDLYLIGEESRVRQLLENLFANAVIHGGDDTTVRVGTLTDGFYVEDDGPGIPMGEREEVFDFGYSTGNGGTGFGLSIVKSVAEAHGWSITLTESSSGGARFEFTDIKTHTDNRRFYTQRN